MVLLAILELAGPQEEIVAMRAIAERLRRKLKEWFTVSGFHDQLKYVKLTTQDGGLFDGATRGGTMMHLLPASDRALWPQAAAAGVLGSNHPLRPLLLLLTVFYFYSHINGAPAAH
jgi:hypothetical protein